MQMVCSLQECGEPVLGSCILLTPHEMMTTDLDDTGMIVYRGMDQGIPTKWVMLHPNCFASLVHEITRQESTTALQVFIGPVGDVREALNIV